jgi:GMP synthase-like glutamine amidotransferase
MKVAILECDDVLEKFQPQFGHYRDMIRRMFLRSDVAADPLRFADFTCRQRHYPEDIDSYDLYITTGSKASVYEDTPWIAQLIHFVRQLDRREKKLIGICFGHQVIAMARQGMVEKSARSWGIGVAVNRTVATPAWMHETKDHLNIIVSHQDQITTLPEDALVIAGSDFCPFFMVQWNDHFLCIQGHPEWNPAYARTLINERRAHFTPERIATALESLHMQPDNELFARWILDFVGYSIPKNIPPPQR